MGLFNRKKGKSQENQYDGLRKQILQLEPSLELQGKSQEHPVYAAVVDMDMGKAIVTLACVADGTTSLYFSNGGGQLGLGQADEEIRRASVAFLRSAEQVLNIMEKVDEYPFPQNKKHIVYLVTAEGVYKQELDMSKINDEVREKQFLNFLYQNVLTKIGAYS